MHIIYFLICGLGFGIMNEWSDRRMLRLTSKLAASQEPQNKSRVSLTLAAIKYGAVDLPFALIGILNFPMPWWKGGVILGLIACFRLGFIASVVFKRDAQRLVFMVLLAMSLTIGVAVPITAVISRMH